MNLSAQVGRVLFHMDGSSSSAEAWNHGTLPLSGPEAKTFPPSLLPGSNVLCSSLPLVPRGLSSPRWRDFYHAFSKESSTLHGYREHKETSWLQRLSHTYSTCHAAGRRGGVGPRTSEDKLCSRSPLAEAVKTRHRLVSKVNKDGPFGNNSKSNSRASCRHISDAVKVMVRKKRRLRRKQLKWSTSLAALSAASEAEKRKRWSHVNHPFSYWKCAFVCSLMSRALHNVQPQPSVRREAAVKPIRVGFSSLCPSWIFSLFCHPFLFFPLYAAGFYRLYLIQYEWMHTGSTGQRWMMERIKEVSELLWKSVQPLLPCFSNGKFPSGFLYSSGIFLNQLRGCRSTTEAGQKVLVGFSSRVVGGLQHSVKKKGVEKRSCVSETSQMFLVLWSLWLSAGSDVHFCCAAAVHGHLSSVLTRPIVKLFVPSRETMV